MTGVIILKLMLAVVAGTMLVLTADELWRHMKYRKDAHRWQWHATMAENRSSDIMWLRDRFWLVVRLFGAVGLVAFVAHFLWTST